MMERETWQQHGESVQGTVLPQGGAGGECSCKSRASGEGLEPPSFVYAIGRIEPRFPRVSLEREYAQVVARVQTSGMTDRQVLHAVLSDRHNRYLVRQLCWSFSVEGLDMYLLTPRDPVDLELLIETLRPRPKPTDLDVVIGTKGPIASPQMCNGLMVPIVSFERLYSFDIDELLDALPRPEDVPAEPFRAAAEEVFQRVKQLADNAGSLDEHRALNYLVVRYSAVYATTADCHRRSASLSGVEVRPSRLGGSRKIVDVIFSYTSRLTDVTEKHFVRVDVTDQFPFLVTKLSPYYDR